MLSDVSAQLSDCKAITSDLERSLHIIEEKIKNSEPFPFRPPKPFKSEASTGIPADSMA